MPDLFDIHDHRRSIHLTDMLQYSGPLLPAFKLRMEQIAQAARWLGAYFHAVAVTLQLPGGPQYRPITKPALDFHNVVWVEDRRKPLGLLAEVLRRLDSEKLLRQLPDGLSPTLPPPRHVKRRLLTLTRPQLLQVAVNCLDRLLVAPVLPRMSAYHERRPANPGVPVRRPRRAKSGKKKK